MCNLMSSTFLRRLAQSYSPGGMGAVFLAEQIAVGNRPVALKVLSRKLLDGPDFLLRFCVAASLPRHGGVKPPLRMGIIHRDHKPDNIFLTYPDDAAAPLVGAHDAGAFAQDVGAGRRQAAAKVRVLWLKLRSSWGSELHHPQLGR